MRTSRPSRSASLVAFSFQNSSLSWAGLHDRWPLSSSDSYSSHVLPGRPSILSVTLHKKKSQIERKRGDVRERLCPFLENRPDKLQVRHELLVLPPNTLSTLLEPVDERQSTSGKEGRRVDLWRESEKVGERGEDNAQDLLLGRRASESQQRWEQIVLPMTAKSKEGVSERSRRL